MAGNPMTPVHFIVDELPPSFGTHPLTGFRMDNIAATYHPVWQAIVGSPINKAGRVGSVYVNMTLQRWFENVALRSEFFEDMTQTGFERMLPELFSTGTLRDPNTNAPILEQVPDIFNRMSLLLPTLHVIHCLSGEEAGNAVNFRDFISTMSDENTYAFVVGRSADGPVHDDVIDTQIKVSNHALTPQTCMTMVCSQLADKWNIN